MTEARTTIPELKGPSPGLPGIVGHGQRLPRGREGVPPKARPRLWPLRGPLKGPSPGCQTEKPQAGFMSPRTPGGLCPQ